MVGDSECTSSRAGILSLSGQLWWGGYFPGKDSVTALTRNLTGRYKFCLSSPYRHIEPRPGGEALLVPPYGPKGLGEQVGEG